MEAGQRVCLVGRNGSGKSTLLRIASGTLRADSGTCFVQPGATMRYLPQEPDLAGFATSLAYVEAGLGPADDPHRARETLTRLGLTGEEDPATLSGGEARRCALARALAPSPDILLLDEPTNHLDLPAIEWLESELTASRAAIVLVSHDRRLLATVSRTVVWLDGGITRRLEQGFAAFETWRDEVLEQEEHAKHLLDRKIAREEDWMRYGVTARRKRNVRRVGLLQDLREQRRTQRSGPRGPRLEAAEAATSGKIVIAADHVDKSYGDTPIVRDFTTRILRGDRVGIVGPNGAGKTTLLRLLTGTLAPDAGEIRLGTALTMATLDQARASLDPAATLADTLTGGGGDTVLVGTEKRHVIGYMKDFLFTPNQARTALGMLSGGERGRVMLARAFAMPANLLVLDEPTNDLDLETLELLQERLAEHPGTVLLVSHDRDFLDHVVTSVIVAEGDGSWVEYAGGYSDMLAQRGVNVAGTPVGAAKPTPKPAAPRAAPPARKLSFKDQHALSTLPAKMAALQADIDKLRAVLADADLYTGNPARFTRATELLAGREQSLAEAEEEWLRLEMLRESLEGAAGTG